MILKDVKKGILVRETSTCHIWGGKLRENDSTNTKERHAILASGPPAYTEGKLFGIPVVDDCTDKW